MSIFSNKMNPVIEEDEIVLHESGYDVTLGGSYDVFMESCDDDLAVIEAMHAYDMAELEAIKESGVDTPVTPVMEASMKEVWEKIKTFFKNLYARVMTFFKNAIDFVSSIVMSGSAFAKKYEERLKGAKFEIKGYEMYKYSIASEFGKDVNLLKSHQKVAADHCKKIADAKGYEELLKLNNAFDGMKDKKIAELRKALAGTEDADKFTEALFNKFRTDGKKKSVTITKIDEYLAFLKNDTVLLNNIKTARDTVNASFKEIESSINSAAAQVKSNDSDTKLNGAKAASMRSSITFFSSMKNVYTRYINMWSDAVKEASGVYKNICFKAMSGASTKK